MSIIVGFTKMTNFAKLANLDSSKIWRKILNETTKEAVLVCNHVARLPCGGVNTIVFFSKY